MYSAGITASSADTPKAAAAIWPKPAIWKPSADHQPAARPAARVCAAAYNMPGPGTTAKTRDAFKNGTR